jgi:hypothetical protein
MSKLKIIHNLDGLTEEQINQYLRDISEHLGIDPDLNAFDVIRMDNRLQVYARRGTTDMLRKSMDIDVTSIDLLDIPGSATFRATGRKGHAASNLSRQEIAIGSCAIAGLTGQKLSDAIMTAETRAGRRLTLKFTGLGILDVSEVPANSAGTASGAELAGSPVVMPPPTVRPAEAPGRDITPSPVDAPPTEAEMEEFRARQAALRAEAKRQLDAQNPPKEGVSSQGIPGEPAGYGIADPPKLGPATPVAETPRRRRRARNTVDISSPGQAPTPSVPEIEAGLQAAGRKAMDMAVEFVKEHTVTPVQIAPMPPLPAAAIAAVAEMQKAAEVITGVVAPPSVPPNVPLIIPQTTPINAGTGLTEEQKKTYFDRWKEYTQNILPKAGMLGMDGVGGSTMQMRKFVQVNNGVAVAQLDAPGWEELLSFLDNYSKQNGPQALVAYIQKAITTA